MIPIAINTPQPINVSPIPYSDWLFCVEREPAIETGGRLGKPFGCAGSEISYTPAVKTFAEGIGVCGNSASIGGCCPEGVEVGAYVGTLPERNCGRGVCSTRCGSA